MGFGFVISLIIIGLKFFSILDITWTVAIMFILVALAFELYDNELSKASRRAYVDTLRERIFSNEKSIKTIADKLDNYLYEIKVLKEEIDTLKKTK